VNPTDRWRAGWDIGVGDYFVDRTALLDPLAMPVCARQVAGLPYLVTENTWVPPMSHRAEGPFLVATYGSIAGLDGWVWFSLGTPGWDATIGKWQIADPSLFGAFPAAAFAFRQGLIGTAPPAVVERRPVADLWTLRSAALPEEAGFDPNRDATAPVSARDGSIDPLAFLVGPVLVDFTAASASVTTADLARHIDRPRGVVRAANGQAELAWARGLCRLDAPAAQGAAGLLGAAGAITTADATFTVRNAGGSVMAVAIDGQPLSKSKRVLLQIGVRSRPNGWKESPAEYEHEGRKYQGLRIDALGHAPWNVERIDAVIDLRNRQLTTATVLEPTLEPRGPLAIERQGDRVRLVWPADALYVVLE
jgi:hypothetical protein